ncbi:SMI1/KNR4 family protein [Afifella sp. H1R]|uniref:SMI1/KNR4 family protein n=1 Tax=Afifella sp. H1R TaxID=2908841 RepID=UPI001F4420DA|nr:SMI1/KNR4 family protein [Afifella sp. H1R]MCF1505570.1 SMI1/KNR4 family protein [Afifella sp. H1R]
MLTIAQFAEGVMRHGEMTVLIYEPQSVCYLMSGQPVCARIHNRGETTRELALSLVSARFGEIARSNVSLPPRRSAYFWGHQPELAEGDRIILTVEADNPSERLTATTTVYAHDRARVGSERTFPGASEAEISAFEAAARMRFCDDYREFLSTRNALRLVFFRGADWQPIEEWVSALNKAEESLPDELQFEDLTDILGIGTPDLGLNQPEPVRADPRLQFYDLRLYPYGYLLGDDGGGNPAVQVPSGKHAGTVMKIDHDVSGLMTDLFEEDLAEGMREELPFQSLDGVSSDDWWDAMIENGVVYQTFPSFSDFLDRHVRRQTVLMETLSQFRV